MSGPNDQPAALPFSKFFTRGPDSVPDGGQSCGIGFVIAWQRGSLDKVGRNGAFLLEVLWACANRLADYQAGPYRCEENQAALKSLTDAIDVLEARLRRRAEEGSLGTHKPDREPAPMMAEDPPAELDPFRAAVEEAIVKVGLEKVNEVFGKRGYRSVSDVPGSAHSEILEELRALYEGALYEEELRALHEEELRAPYEDEAGES